MERNSFETAEVTESKDLKSEVTPRKHTNKAKPSTRSPSRTPVIAIHLHGCDGPYVNPNCTACSCQVTFSFSFQLLFAVCRGLSQFA